jgi:hypothetical protein
VSGPGVKRKGEPVGFLKVDADFGAVIDYLAEGSNLSAVAVGLEVERSQLYRWKKGAATPSPRMRRALFDAMKKKARTSPLPEGPALEAFVAAGGKVAVNV